MTDRDSPNPSAARIEAAVEAFCAVHPQISPSGWQFRIKAALRAADEPERPGVERLVAALRGLEREGIIEDDSACDCSCCEAIRAAITALAEFESQPTGESS